MILESGMTLYHGTNECFNQIQIFGHSSVYKDFGQGFYLTSSWEQALRHAHNKARNKGRPYVYMYEVKSFDRNNYRILELLQYDEQWVEFLTYNRIFGGNTKKYSGPQWANFDVVYDRMADNQYGTIDEDLRNYAKGQISADKVIADLTPKKQWDQFCFKTKRALGLLSKIGCCDFSGGGDCREA